MENKKMILVVLIDFSIFDHLQLHKIIKNKFNINQVCLNCLKSYISKTRKINKTKIPK